MAYLPTVNETKESFEVGDSLIKTLKKRFSFSLLNRKVIASPKQTSEPLATKQDNSTTILNKLYQFIVKDTQRQNIEDDETLREQEDESVENEFIQKTLIERIDQPEEKIETKEEGILSKLWRYFKYFSFGRMVFRNWDTISKLLGLEKLTESIKSIADEFGITKILDEIKTTINSILDDFSLGNLKFETDNWRSNVPKVTGPSSINAADPNKVNQAMQFFISKGLTPEQASGVVGNMLQENPAFALDIGGDHGKAGGLFQWQGARQKGMGTTFEAQLQHAWDEMTGKSETRDIGSERALEDLRKSSTPAEAAVAVQGTARGRGLTRAGSPMMENRIRYSQGALELYDRSKTTTSIPSEFVGPPIPESKKGGGTSTTTSTGIVNTSVRIPKNYAEPGETGTGEMTKTQRKSIVNRDIATKDDLKGLNFQYHPGNNNEDDQILKVLAQKLQQLKSAIGVSSLYITSGYRSPAYNEALSKRKKGVAKDSYHTRRKASDIIIPNGYKSEDIANFVRTASKLGFGGIGVYLGSGFIHLDIGPVRTWTYGLPKPIQDALSEHISGRVGHQVIKDIPELAEPGETGNTQGGNIPQEGDNKKDPAKDFDYLKFALDSYKTQLSVVNSVFNQALSGQGAARIESMLEQLSGNIPRKDNMIPDMSGMFIQNNTIISNINQKKQISNNLDSRNLDIPPIFNNPFLSSYYKD